MADDDGTRTVVSGTRVLYRYSIIYNTTAPPAFSHHHHSALPHLFSAVLGFRSPRPQNKTQKFEQKLSEKKRPTQISLSTFRFPFKNLYETFIYQDNDPLLDAILDFDWIVLHGRILDSDCRRKG